MEKMGFGGTLTFEEKAAVAAMGRASQAFNGLNKKSDQLATSTNRGRDSLGHFTAGAKQALGPTQKLQKNIGGLAAGMGSMAILATMATAPIAMMATAGASAAADFEAQMSTVGSVLRKRTGPEIDALNAKARDLGASTVFTATQSGQAMEFMARAGASTGEIMAGIGGVMDAAAADGMELAEAAGIVSKTVRGMGLSFQDSTGVADVLAHVSSKTNTNISQLGHSLTFATSQARIMGVPYRELVATLGALADAGLQGTLGGTSLTQMFVKLNKPSRKGLALMKKWKIALTQELPDGTKKMLPMSRIVEQFTENIDKIRDPMKRAQAMTELFGVRGQKAFAALGAKGAKELQKLVDGANASQGAAAEMASIRLDNFSGQMTLLRSAMEGLAIEAFTPLLQTLKPMIKDFAQAIQGITKGEGAGAGILSGIKQGIEAIASGIQMAWSFGKKLWAQISATLGPSGVATLVKWATVLGGIAVAAMPFMAVLSMIAFMLPGIIVGLKAMGAYLAVAGGFAMSWLLPAVLAVGAAILLWDDMIKPYLDGLYQGLLPAINAIKEEWTILVMILKESWEQITAAFGEGTSQMSLDWKAMGKMAGTVLGWIIKGVAIAINIVAVLFKTFGVPIIKWIASMRDGFMDIGVTLIDNVLAPLRLILMTAVRLAKAVGVSVPRGLEVFADKGLRGFVKARSNEATGSASGIGSRAAEAAGRAGARQNITVDSKVENKLDVKLDNKLEVDGREIAFVTADHVAEVTERGGFKAKPWQRRRVLDMDAAPVPTGG